MFQKRILEKYIAKLDKTVLDEKYKIFCSIFANPEKQENIRNSKEEQYQEGFLRDLFVSVLGYTINPEPNYNLITEQRNTSTKKDNRKADGAIIFDNNIKAVIELKGTDTTDLNKIESQAFLYKEHNLNCKYVVISNFERLRFYIENAIEFKEFNLFKLSKEDFQVLYLCLELNQIKNDIPLLVKNETVSEEKEITDNFYNDYSVFKRNLFEDIYSNNPEYDKLLLFKKTQKLLDRILFVFFCEDRGLLPINSINTIIQQWEQLKDLDAYQPLYSRFQNYFNRINEGYKSPKNPSENIFAYNGGLFKPDEILDKIKIGDDVLFLYTKRLSNYDFESQISVDILGHIFEHSLTEIEEVQKQLEAEKSGLVVEKTDIGKRKKDGVFYTPAYITKYIVENTIGKLCNDKKEEIGIKDSDFSKQKKTSKEKDELLKKLDSYKEWLLSLKILDPACGSGAFLNSALKQLKTEHTLIDYYRAKIYGDSLIFQDVENVILEKNIFGVDINEESVEIAKLSLWLHTAQKDRKLTTLNNNIKCGNSLIDDPEIAGDKAFNWEKEFPEVFENGGFDVVIGNPPYVRRTQLDDKQKNGLEKKFFSAYKQYDLYVLFNELAINLVKQNGFIGLIQPNKFLSAEYGLYISNYIKENCIVESIKNVSLDNVFKDASVYPYIFVYQKKTQNTNIKVENISLLNIAKNLIGFENINISNKIIEKLREKSKTIKEITSTIKRGIPNTKITFEEKSNIYAVKSTFISKPYCFPLENLAISYLNKDDEHNKIEEFSQDLVLLPRTILKIRAIKNDRKTHILDRIYYFPINKDFDINFILSILNSKITTYFYDFVYGSTKIGGGYIDLKGSQIENFLIPNITINQQQPFIELAEKMLILNADLQKKSSKFIGRLKESLSVEKITSNLENFYNFDFEALVKELSKQKIKLSLKQKDEWEEYFNDYKNDISEINKQIETTDKEINSLVYKLYELTPEEIETIEKSM